MKMIGGDEDDDNLHALSRDFKCFVILGDNDHDDGPSLLVIQGHPY